MTDPEIIRAAIDATGLSARRFAVEVLARNERTVRRWLAGENALPAAVRSKCEALIAEASSRPRSGASG